MREYIKRKVLGAVVVFAFICIVVPLHILDVCRQILKRLLPKLPLRIVGTAAIVGVSGVLVAMNVVEEIPESEVNAVCAGLWGCGAPRLIGAGELLVVACVLGGVLALAGKLAEHDREVDG